MIFSMTGFGKSQYEDERISIRVEIKSVNSKQFDLKLRLPLEYSAKDPIVRSKLKKVLYRGKIECYVTLERNDIMPYQLNSTLVGKYFDMLKHTASSLGLNWKKESLLRIIMQMPEVLRQQRMNEDPDIWEKINLAIDEAVEELTLFRRQEGEAMARDILKNLDRIESYLDKVPSYEDERIETVKQRILQALENLDVDVDKARFEQELVYYLDKFDINEEKVRLRNHITFFRQVLDQAKEPVGKKLTFIVQEMGREINTLGAKANHFQIQQLVVNMKDELEKIREQLANIL